MLEIPEVVVVVEVTGKDPELRNSAHMATCNLVFQSGSIFRLAAENQVYNLNHLMDLKIVTALSQSTHHHLRLRYQDLLPQEHPILFDDIDISYNS